MECIGTAGSALNLLNSPTSIFINTNDILYINDTGNYRIVAYPLNTASGTVVADTGVGGTALNQLAVGGNGTSGTSLGQVDFPYGVWADSSANIFVVEHKNQRVTKWTLGAITSVVVAGITNTSGKQKSRKAHYTDDTLSFGSLGVAANRLWSPMGIYYDEMNQNLYISNIGSASTIAK